MCMSVEDVVHSICVKRKEQYLRTLECCSLDTLCMITKSRLTYQRGTEKIFEAEYRLFSSRAEEVYPLPTNISNLPEVSKKNIATLLLAKIDFRLIIKVYCIYEISSYCSVYRFGDIAHKQEDIQAILHEVFKLYQDRVYRLQC